MTTRRVPVFSHRVLRPAAGLLLALLGPLLAASLMGAPPPRPVALLLFALLVWLPASWLTDKYVHKYPRRYDSYLLASHFKAAVIMALVLLAATLIGGPEQTAVFWLGLPLSLAADLLLSLPRRAAPPLAADSGPAIPGSPAPQTPPIEERRPSIDTPTLLQGLDSTLGDPFREFVQGNLPDLRGGSGSVLIVDQFDPTEPSPEAPRTGLLAARTSLNHVDRLNIFLGQCADRVVLDGFLAVRYTPLETVLQDLRRQYPGLLHPPAYLLHFLWYRAIPKLPWLDRLYFSRGFAWLDRLILRTAKRRNRTLPKAEVWGRLAFWGFEVIAESEGDGERFLLAQRVSPPVANRRPSYYAVVALEKVGLDGRLIRLHKVRSMYPFSEFLQRRLYQSHGLTATGKFKDDFRLTEYGKLIRRHWIDELPGLFDWLRGEIKLVGMRATSPQFLSTYPRELYDLYIQIKPGLIPPIFDESTGGFAAIVATELTYLQRYRAAPVRTDLSYFWYTFRDIVFRRVRSH